MLFGARPRSLATTAVKSIACAAAALPKQRRPTPSTANATLRKSRRSTEELFWFARLTECLGLLAVNEVLVPVWLTMDKRCEERET
jgi:hypothetical protein